MPFEPTPRHRSLSSANEFVPSRIDGPRIGANEAPPRRFFEQAVRYGAQPCGRAGGEGLRHAVCGPDLAQPAFPEPGVMARRE